MLREVFDVLDFLDDARNGAEPFVDLLTDGPADNRDHTVRKRYWQNRFHQDLVSRHLGQSERRERTDNRHHRLERRLTAARPLSGVGIGC